MGELLFEAKGVGKTYGANTVLHDIDMQIYGGEVIGLIGENGAGKSTLMKLISGVIVSTSANTRMKDRARAFKEQIMKQIKMKNAAGSEG